MPRGRLADDCADAARNTAPGGSEGVTLTADVADGAIVAPGDDIAIRLTWDPKAWSGDALDAALACVQVKGILDPKLSGEERPTANDGVFEYRLHVPENIRPDCDICVQGFLAGVAAGGGPQQVGSNERCFMSGSPRPPATSPSAPPSPPATSPSAPPASSPAAPASSTAPVPAASPAPADVPAQVAGITATRPAPAPAPAPDAAPAGELPRTGAFAIQAAAAGSGMTLTLGGLAVIGGAGRRLRRRTGA